MKCNECILNTICREPCEDLIKLFLNGKHYDKEDEDSYVCATCDAYILRKVIIAAQNDEDFNNES